MMIDQTRQNIAALCINHTILFPRLHCFLNAYDLFSLYCKITNSIHMIQRIYYTSIPDNQHISTLLSVYTSDQPQKGPVANERSDKISLPLLPYQRSGLQLLLFSYPVYSFALS